MRTLMSRLLVSRPYIIVCNYVSGLDFHYNPLLLITALHLPGVFASQVLHKSPGVMTALHMDSFVISSYRVIHSVFCTTMPHTQGHCTFMFPGKH